MKSKQYILSCIGIYTITSLMSAGMILKNKKDLKKINDLKESDNISKKI